MTEEEEFADDFREKAIELLSKMEEVIVLLENDPKNQELINHLFRIMHTLKGSGAMFGFKRIADFAHCLETAIDSVRSETLVITPEFINLLLRSRDQIQEMLYAAGGESESDSKEIDLILAALKKLPAQVTLQKGEEFLSNPNSAI